MFQNVYSFMGCYGKKINYDFIYYVIEKKSSEQFHVVFISNFRIIDKRFVCVVFVTD